ncbi:MAG: flagellar biosynthesis protein FlhB [Candidatus Hydrogenedentota bacterium]
MPEEQAGEKTLPASERKKEQARERGNVPKSQDLNSAITLSVGLLGLWFLGWPAFERLQGATRHYLREVAHPQLDVDIAHYLAGEMAMTLGTIVLPIMALLVVAGIASNVLQFGFLIAPQALTPKFQKLNPFEGLKKFVSARTLVEFLKSMLKLVMVVLIVYITVSTRWEELLTLIFMEPLDIVQHVGWLIALVWFRVCAAMLILGIIDFAFQRWQHEQDLRMTVQEAKQETKEMEGDPQLKQRVRQIQRQLATQRMMEEIPLADVVVTNPVTYAVALRYDPESMQAPTVVAKGARLLAERIREIAIENDVPIVERPDMARTLYKGVEVGHPVPENLFRAVAEVLAYVYKIDRRTEKIRERERMNYPAGAAAG